MGFDTAKSHQIDPKSTRQGTHTSRALASLHRLAAAGLDDGTTTTTTALEVHAEPSQTCHRNLC